MCSVPVIVRTKIRKINFYHIDIDLETKLWSSPKTFLNKGVDIEKSECNYGMQRSFTRIFRVNGLFNFVPYLDGDDIRKSEIWIRKGLGGDNFTPHLGIFSKERWYDFEICTQLQNSSTAPLSIYLNHSLKCQNSMTLHWCFIA